MISDMTLYRLFPVALPLMLMACAMQPPVPVAARLSQQALRVEMSDGALCSAALAGDAPWSGDVPACGLHYVVTPTAAGSPIRLAFDAMIAALRAGALVAPTADIVVTDSTGTSHAFTSPVVDDP
jgi:hypothetical protein